MGRGLSVVAGQVAPFPLSGSAHASGALVIPVAPAAADLGTVALPGGNVSKKIEVSVTITTTGGAMSIDLNLFRNGSALAFDTYTHIIEGATTETINAHWYDDDPGPGVVSYSVRASSVGVNAATAFNRRVTVQSTGGT